MILNRFYSRTTGWILLKFGLELLVFYTISKCTFKYLTSCDSKLTDEGSETEVLRSGGKVGTIERGGFN